jgi:hypothetical protein
LPSLKDTRQDDQVAAYPNRVRVNSVCIVIEEPGKRIKFIVATPKAIMGASKSIGGGSARATEGRKSGIELIHRQRRADDSRAGRIHCCKNISNTQVNGRSNCEIIHVSTE